MPALVAEPVTHPAAPFAHLASHLAAADRAFAAALAGYGGAVRPLVEHLDAYRGKRLRPALLLLTADACGGVRPAHHTLAAVVEMIHTATLVHDDVLDEADTRRHVPTVNAGFGNKASILFGDLLFTHAFHLTASVDAAACRLIGEATNRVCAGELMQVRNRGNLHLTEAEYTAIIDGKTAALTEVSTRLGALYAGASAEAADRLATYGRMLGRAFQVADDVLDLTGDEAVAGKTLGTDLDQGKLTLPLIHALNALPAAEANRVRDAIADRRPDRDAVVAAALARTTAVAVARRRADEYAAQARAAVAGLPAGPSRQALEQLTGWAVRRAK